MTPIKGFDLATGFAFDPSNLELYVSNQRNGTVSALDSATNGVLASIFTDTGVLLGAFDPVKARKL